MDSNKCTIIDKLRQPKIFNMALFDWICTFIAAIVICYFAYKKIDVTHVLIIFGILIIAAILIHKLFGINTMLNAYLGLNTKDSVLKNRKNC